MRAIETVIRERWEPYDPEEAAEVSPLLLFCIRYAAEPDSWSVAYYDDLREQLGLAQEELYGEFRRLHFGWYLQAWNLERDSVPRPDDDVIFFKVPEEHYRLVTYESEIRRPLPEEIRAAVHERFGYTCVYCGGVSEEVDHVVPVSRGGTDNDENLVASCTGCNRRKSDRLLSELGWRIKFDGSEE